MGDTFQFPGGEGTSERFRDQVNSAGHRVSVRKEEKDAIADLPTHPKRGTA